MTAIETAMKEIRVRDEMREVIYTDSLSSMLAIENNRENHPILNQIYDTLAELQNQGKQITIGKVPAHIGVKGNEEANRAAKQAIDIPGILMACFAALSASSFPLTYCDLFTLVLEFC